MHHRTVTPTRFALTLALVGGLLAGALASDRPALAQDTADDTITLAPASDDAPADAATRSVATTTPSPTAEAMPSPTAEASGTQDSPDATGSTEAGVAATAANLGDGDRVVVATDALNLRDGPGLDADVVAVLLTDETLTVTGATQTVDDLRWAPVVTASSLTGWVAADYLAVVPDAALPMDPGDSARVETDALNLRIDGSLEAEVLSVLGAGDTMTIVGGPTTADGYTWYQVKTDAGEPGWVAADFISLADAVDLAVEDLALVNTDALNVRAEAGLDADILDTLVLGDELRIVSGPVVADDLTWYQVSVDGKAIGWVAGAYLAAAA